MRPSCVKANRHIRRPATFAATAALLTMTAWVSATTVPSGGTHSAPRIRHISGGPVVNTVASTLGWRVVATVGPDLRPLGGLLAAASAGDAWSAWSGSIFTVEHSTGGAWQPVTMPPQVGVDPDWSPMSVGAGPGGEVWMFSQLNPGEAIRHTGGRWVLQPVPGWVLQPGPGTVSATTTAVFGPRDVWVFSLGAGGAHYDGHTWAKVTMPEVPEGVSAAAPGDIWASGRSIGFVMHWNGTTWVKVALPVRPLPHGVAVSYSNIMGVGPQDAWLMRTISRKTTVLSTAMLHWTGKTWLTVASPADVVGSLVPDGNGGLWADGTGTGPGGSWYIYHLAGRHWTKFTPPVMFIHSPQVLTWIPGTRSVWATGSNYNPAADYNHKGYYGVILKYGP